jgi:O-antigen/teichoic acid export membrane protein
LPKEHPEAQLGGRSSLLGPSAWLALGNIVYGVSQVTLIAVLAKAFSPAVVGAFVLASAIIVPVFLLADMNLRIVVATDPSGRILDSAYRGVRERTVVIAAALCLVIGLMVGPTRQQFLLFAAVLTYKIADSLSNLAYGFAYRQDRAKEVGYSMIGRGSYSIMVGSAVLIAVPWASVAIFIVAFGWLAAAFWEWRRFGLGSPRLSLTPLAPGTLGTFVRKSGFLGLDGLANSFHQNIPRYHIQAVSGSVELGVFGALSSLTNGITMVAGAASNVILPRLAQFCEAGNKREFYSLLYRLVLTGSLISIPIVGLSAAVGEDLVGLAVGSDYARGSIILALTVGACINVLGQFLGKGLQAAQAFRTLLLTNIAASLLTVCVLVPFNNAWGTAGAGWAIAFGGALRFLLIAFLVRQVEI